MARKPVKIVTDLQVNKQIKKTDNNNNTLFDVSGTLENGHVSSSLPLTASNIYTPGNLEVGGTITANQYHVTYQTSSVITTSGSTKFGNSSDDIHQFSGSIFVSGNVTSNNFYGTASFATTAQTASYVSSGSAIQTFVSDVRSQFSAGTDINITNGVISYTGVGGGGGVSAEEVSGAITSSTSNFASRSEVSGVLNNYATIINVSASFATPTQVTSALVAYPSRVEVTGALSNYLLITGASSSFAELTDLTASNITNFTSDVRSQFSAGPNITINNGVITGSASGVTNVEVSGAITGALVNYATVLGVSSSFVTPSQVTNSIANFASRTEVTGVLNNYLLVTNASASFAELSDLTASNINNFSSDVRAQFSAGPNIVINNGTITGSASGASSVEVSGAITGALTSYASLVGVSSSFVTPSNVTSALEPYALSSNISSSFVVPQQVTSAITNLASRAEVTGALGNYLLISAASSSFAELTDLTASNITNFTSDVRAQFVAGPNITINDGVITGSASTGVSSLEVSGAITGALVSYLSISEASSSFAELSDLTASNISNFTSDVRSKFSAGTDISILNGQISYTGVGGGGLTTVETSGSITGSGIVSNPVTLKDPLVIGTVTASLGFSGNLNGTSSYATNAATASTSLVGAAEDGDYTDGLFTDITTVTPVGTVIDRFNEILKALSPAPAPDLTNMDRGTGNIGTNSMYLAFGTGSKEVSGYTAVTASLGATLTNVSFAGQFNRIGSTNRETRLGTFATLTALSMTLNNATTADAATYTNYPADAFNVSTDGIGTYKLEINDNEVTPNGSTSTTGSATTQTFVLTAANTASFTNSGQGLNIFRHRTGTVGIPTSLWRNGHNYAKVSHVSSLGTHVTNYVDWVYDPSGSAGSVEPYVFSTPTTQSFTVSGEKRLSGIGYYTSVSYNFSCSVDNYYKNVYTTSGLTFTSATTGLSIIGVTILPPTTNESNIQVNSSHTFTGGYRLLGATLTSRLQAANTLGKTGLSTALTTNTILYDNVSTDGNTTVVEQFKAENYRATSGSYDTQTSASSAISAFPSSSALTSGELAVYNGAVRYPTQVLNSGNVSGSSVVYKLGNQPNYSGVTDNRGYFRVFRNGSSSKSTFTITITGGDSNFRVVPYNQALDANKVRIWIKVPEKTGWRDISTTPSTTDTTGIEFTDNFGCLEGSVIVAGSTSTHGINLLKDGLSPSDYFVLKIEASSAFTNSISNITISGL